MNPYLQEVLHQIGVRLAEVEAKNKMLEAECAALREQIRELEHDRNYN
jgi:cell division protein FtsB